MFSSLSSIWLLWYRFGKFLLNLKAFARCSSWAGGMVLWWQHSPTTNVARVRFPDLASYVGLVWCPGNVVDCVCLNFLCTTIISNTAPSLLTDRNCISSHDAVADSDLQAISGGLGGGGWGLNARLASSSWNEIFWRLSPLGLGFGLKNEEEFVVGPLALIRHCDVIKLLSFALL